MARPNATASSAAMSEQLTIDFDPAATAAEATAQAAADAAFAELVETRTVAVSDARAHDLYYQGDDHDTVTVRICPACGTWEPNEMLLANNHGIDRDDLVQWPDGEWGNDGAYYGRRWCIALDLTANHATYADGHLHSRQLAMLVQLRPEVRQLYEHEVRTRPHRRHLDTPPKRSPSDAT